MTPLAFSPPREGRRFLTTTLFAGLTVGALDAVFAVVLYRSTPVRIFHSIASGLLGGGAYQGGMATAALGALLHLLIATLWAGAFVAASFKAPMLVRRAPASGLLYGAIVYGFMNYVVLPLSAVSFARPFSLELLGNGRWWIGLVGHMLLIGLPIALFARRMHTSLGARELPS